MNDFRDQVGQRQQHGERDANGYSGRDSSVDLSQIAKEDSRGRRSEEGRNAPGQDASLAKQQLIRQDSGHRRRQENGQPASKETGGAYMWDDRQDEKAES
jgi:hypothetical protein